MGNMFNVLQLQVNQVLIGCSTEECFTLHIKRIGLKNWYAKCPRYLFTHHGFYKQRKLAQVYRGPHSSSSPPTAPTPPILVSPFSLPFHHLVKDSSSEVTSDYQLSNVRSSDEDMENTVIITTIIVTALVTFVFAGVVFFYWRRYYGSDWEHSRNDESHLLSLSLSKHSLGHVASSYKLIVVEDKEETLGGGIQFVNNKLNDETSGNFTLESHIISNSTVEIQLEKNLTSTQNMMDNTTEMPPTLLGIVEVQHLTSIPGRINHLVPDPPPPPTKRVALSPSSPPPSPPSPPLPSKEVAQPLTLPKNANAAPPPSPPPTLPQGSTQLAPIPRGPVPPPPPPVKVSSVGPRMSPLGPPPPPVPPGLKAGPRPPAPGPPPPPLPFSHKPGPQPPPPPNGIKPPRPAPPLTSTSLQQAGGPKTKLKPFFWDKVPAKPDDSMIWHQIRDGSFQFNEEMIEALFGFAPVGKSKNDGKKESSSQDHLPKYVKLIDAKKAQNLAILLKALNVTTEEVSDAIEEGNELPVELIQTLLKMAPTSDEELKLRLYDGNLSQLGPAERFLKVLISIPFAFKRLELFLFMCTLQEESVTLKESFVILEAACTELRKSRLFLKLLEAVLKTGNRMNIGTFRGGAQAFKLDTLLKLSDVKGVDGKTTLLHFVVLEIIRSEGRRATRASRESLSISSLASDDLLEDIPDDTDEKLRSMGLEVVSGLGNDLDNVRKAAVIDSDSLAGIVAKLGHALVKAREFLNSDMKSVEDENGFYQTLKSFLENAEVDVMWLLEEEKRIMAMVKSTGDYFHGNSVKDEGLRLFVVVRDFLTILDKVCREVKNTPRKPK